MNDRIEQFRVQYDKLLAELVCRKVNHQDCCYDILQDVYLKMIQHIGKIEKAEKIVPYIMRLASNTVMDHYRTQNNIEASVEQENIVWGSEKEGMSKTHVLASSFLIEMIEGLPLFINMPW